MTSALEDFDANYDKKDHNCHNCDELCHEPSFFPCFSDTLASPLCVPQDPLEELEWYPSFCNDIDLDSSLQSDFNFFDTPENDKFETKAKCDQVSLSNVQNKSSFVTTKPRTMKPRRKRAFGGAWSKSVVGFQNSKLIRGHIKRGKKCSHCETKHTPQWRAGPLGRNTLCNACGVRYKSGRLLPEYRPAASPTFDGKKHSNFHKNILKKKEH